MGENNVWTFSHSLEGSGSLSTFLEFFTDFWTLLWQRYWSFGTCLMTHVTYMLCPAATNNRISLCPQHRAVRGLPWKTKHVSQNAWRNIRNKKYSFIFFLFFYVPVNNFSVMSGQVFLDWTRTKQRIKCLAQGGSSSQRDNFEDCNNYRNLPMCSVICVLLNLIQKKLPPEGASLQLKR